MSFIPKDHPITHSIISTIEVLESIERSGDKLVCSFGSIDEILLYSDGVHGLARMDDSIEWKFKLKSGYPVNENLDGDLFKITIESREK